MADVNNKRYPDSQIASQYPYAKVTMHPDGSGRYEDHTPDHETFREFFAGGGHREVGNSPDGGIGREVLATLGKVFHNLADGMSHTVAGHHDRTTGGNHREQTEGDHHEEKGGNHYNAIAGHVVSTTNETVVNHTADGDHHHITSGDHIIDHDGSIHTNVSNDHISHVEGNHGLVVAKGDHGIQLQSGNMNIEVTNGEYNLKTLHPITIRSVEKITLKVGKNTIVMDQNGITITAIAVSFVKAS